MTNDNDRQVAERVMGWKLQIGANGNIAWSCGVATAYRDYDDWHPTSNIEQATMVVDKLRKNFFIKIEGVHKSDNTWGVTFFNRYEGFIDAKHKQIYNESLPLAICEAALKAVE